MSYEVGQKLRGGVARLRETQTEPPKRYTEGMLISAMTNVHRLVTNEADKKILRDTKGIGTERTRGEIIETLKKRGYITRGKGGELCPTELGIALIQNLPRELSDPVTTAKWEMALGLIEQGKMTRQQFGSMTRANTIKLVQALEALAGKFDLDRLGVKESDKKAGPSKARPEVDESLPGHGTTCEKCKKGQMVGKRFSSGKAVLGCSNYPACKHSKWID